MTANSSDFYRARAAECALAAQSATLANVRERCLNAKRAWLVMADQVESEAALRDERPVPGLRTSLRF